VTRRGKTSPVGQKQTVRCAIYTRKSTEEGLEQGFNSLDAQREAGEAYIASLKGEGWVCLPDRYDDGGFSGGNMERPALKRLMADIDARHVDCVVVYKVDRLSRSLMDFATIMGILDKAGVAFVAVTQAFNSGTPAGRLMLNVLLSFSEFERELIRERTRDKLAAARKKGKWVGGTPVLGYDIVPDGGRLIVNQDEAARVRDIFALYAEKESLRATLREMERRGWGTKQWTTRKGRERGGKPLTRNGLYTMLMNPIYVGRVKHNGSTYPGEHEPIVDPAIWEQVQSLLRRNGRSGGRAIRNKGAALLGGLLWCAACGVKMSHTYSERRGKRYRYYTCFSAQQRGWHTCPTKSLPAGEIERFVVEQIRRIGGDPKLLAEVLRKIRDDEERRSDDLDRERRSAESDLKQFAAEVKRIARSIGKDAKATAQMAEFQGRISAAEQCLVEIRAKRAAAASEAVDEAQLAAALRDFGPLWDSLPPREQARVLHLLVERVTYDPVKETVAITFRPTEIGALIQEGAA